MGNAGIGERCAIAIALHTGQPLNPAWLKDGKLNPGWWGYERGNRTLPPREYIGPVGSANHKSVGTLLDLLTKRELPTPAQGWESSDPRDWLTEWYRVMACEGHDGYELLSTIYGGAHSISAMICADLGIPGAAAHLQRQVALYALHLTADKRLVMAGCRSKRRDFPGSDKYPPRLVAADEDPALELFARYMLGEDRPTREIVVYRKKRKAVEHAVVRGGMEIELARRINARRFVGDEALWRKLEMTFVADKALHTATLPTVRSAVSTLVHRRHERGFVSYFETGPRAHAWPIAAVVAVDGQEPVIVRPPTSKQGKGAGEVRTVLEPSGDLFTQQGTGAWGVRHDTRSLGPLVREVRIEGPKVAP